MKTKRCPRCKQTLPAAAFYVRASGYLSSYCQTCHRNYYQKRYVPRQRTVSLHCPRCRTTKTHGDFGWCKGGRRYAYCKPCMQAHSAAWRAANPEKHRRNWQQNNVRMRLKQLKRIIEGKSL